MERLFQLLSTEGDTSNSRSDETQKLPLFGSTRITHKTYDFIMHCIDFLLAYGPNEQGIFRVPGEGELVKKLKDEVNKEAMRPDTDFTRLGWKKAQVAEVASLFKLFFREMPDSLLQHELYDCFISVFGMPVEHRAHVLSRVICLLEPERVRILESLLIFLRELAKHSEKTLMNTHNLAIVFAPNILRSGTDNPGQVITDAKATLEIVNLLLIDPTITTTRVEEVIKLPKPLPDYDAHPQPAPLSSKHQEFRKTMQENYQAIRKDSTRKLEQASRKSRISHSEFTKKMEVLSQKILDGEIDPAMFDEAALKFMDPQLIAQFSGQDQPLLTGHRAGRKERNANRHFGITGAFSPPTGGDIRDFELLSGQSTSPPPSNQVTSLEYDSHPDSTLSDTSDTAETQSGPGSGEILSPRAGTMPRAKPSLNRTPSQSGSTIEVGLQRNRSHHLTKSGQNANTSASASPAAVGLGSHRPKGSTQDLASSDGGSTSGTAHAPVGPIQEWHRTSHRSSDPAAVTTSRSPPMSAKSDSAPDSSAGSPRQQEEEDLDDIMGDLLQPYHHSQTETTSTPSISTPRRADSKYGLPHQPNMATFGSPGTNETAALVTLELLELMLGNSELPEIVIPTEDVEEVPEVDDPAASLSEEEVETPITPSFPTTGLFSSPLIAASSRSIHSAHTHDPSIPSMSDINDILNS
jgi:hypothetical protein